MKLLLIAGVLAAAYCYSLLRTSDMLVGQVMQIHKTYSYVGAHADKLAGATNQ